VLDPNSVPDLSPLYVSVSRKREMETVIAATDISGTEDRQSDQLAQDSSRVVPMRIVNGRPFKFDPDPTGRGEAA
jgi:hypothetical protein